MVERHGGDAVRRKEARRGADRGAPGRKLGAVGEEDADDSQAAISSCSHVSMTVQICTSFQTAA